jgi:chromate reductase, NAD(P)H dehydrogenase (quinone)
VLTSRHPDCPIGPVIARGKARGLRRVAASVVSILTVSGSTRQQSTNSAACRTAVSCAPSGLTVTAYTSLAALPHFDPDLDPDLGESGREIALPSPVAAMRSLIATADAVLFCTPEYAGTLPGSFKNLLDWTVGATVLTAKPVAWIGVAADPRRGSGAHATLPRPCSNTFRHTLCTMRVDRYRLSGMRSDWTG